MLLYFEQAECYGDRKGISGYYYYCDDDYYNYHYLLLRPPAPSQTLATVDSVCGNHHPKTLDKLNLLPPDPQALDPKTQVQGPEQKDAIAFPNGPQISQLKCPKALKFTLRPATPNPKLQKSRNLKSQEYAEHPS